MRDFLIVAKCDRFYAWTAEAGKSAKEAGKEFFGIIECGGNIWETGDGNLPEDVDLTYEVVAEVDVTGLSAEHVAEMAEYLKRMSDLSVVNRVLEA